MLVRRMESKDRLPGMWVQLRTDVIPHAGTKPGEWTKVHGCADDFEGFYIVKYPDSFSCGVNFWNVLDNTGIWE